MHLLVQGKHAIVYPAKGLEGVLDRTKKGSVGDHLCDLYQSNEELRSGRYHIIILWKDGADIMADVWIFDKIGQWGSGPLVDAKTYRGMKRVHNMGVGAGDGMIMIGMEEESRQEIMDRQKRTLEDYLIGGRPKLPGAIRLDEQFYFDATPFSDVIRDLQRN